MWVGCYTRHLMAYSCKPPDPQPICSLPARGRAIIGISPGSYESIDTMAAGSLFIAMAAAQFSCIAGRASSTDRIDDGRTAAFNAHRHPLQIAIVGWFDYGFP